MKAKNIDFVCDVPNTDGDRISSVLMSGDALNFHSSLVNHHIEFSTDEGGVKANSCSCC